jgi:hypothetical protein
MNRYLWKRERERKKEKESEREVEYIILRRVTICEK